MTDATDTDPDQQVYADLGKPHPVELLDGLNPLDLLTYLEHIMVAAQGPYAAIVDMPAGQAPDALVAEAGIISGSLQSMAVSLHQSYETVRAIVEQIDAEAGHEPVELVEEISMNGAPDRTAGHEAPDADAPPA